MVHCIVLVPGVQQFFLIFKDYIPFIVIKHWLFSLYCTTDLVAYLFYT